MNENNQYPYPGTPVPPPQVPLKICPKCKAQIGKTLQVCPYCGTKQGTKIGCLGVAGIAIGVIVLLSLLTSCVNVLTGRNRKASEETSVTATIAETTASATTVTETEPPTTEPPTTETTVPETETEPETEQETEPETEPGTSAQDVIDAVNGGDYSLVTPEFKELMDSYEAFVDEYVAFMQNYKNSTDPMAMTNDYLALIQRETEWMNKIDAIDEKTLTPADDAYYLLVTLRASGKLMGASLSAAY